MTMEEPISTLLTSGSGKKVGRWAITLASGQAVKFWLVTIGARNTVGWSKYFQSHWIGIDWAIMIDRRKI